MSFGQNGTWKIRFGWDGTGHGALRVEGEVNSCYRHGGMEHYPPGELRVQ